jgi:hypothetical protein
MLRGLEQWITFVIVEKNCSFPEKVIDGSVRKDMTCIAANNARLQGRTLH